MFAACPARYQIANSLNLIIVKGDGDLSGRHTNYHTLNGLVSAGSPWKSSLGIFLRPSEVQTTGGFTRVGCFGTTRYPVSWKADPQT
jgi:hypothetical protein